VDIIAILGTLMKRTHTGNDTMIPHLPILWYSHYTNYGSLVHWRPSGHRISG